MGDRLLARFVFADGTWEVDGDLRELRTHGRAVPIGSRAFEIIEKLVEAAGQFVSKDELVAHVWRGETVEENTLRVHIHAIRKALGSDRTLLKSAAGRGYLLQGRWTSRQESDRSTDDIEASVGREISNVRRSNLPAAASDIVGRMPTVKLLKDLVSAFRVVTLTGPGGIGKTTLALEVARGLLAEFDGRIFLAELGALSDPDLVPSAVARALGLVGEGKRLSAGEIARSVGTSKLLLVLDNCEHLVDATALFVEELVRQCPRLCVLVTSRETLKVDGERVHRLQPLEIPDQGETVPERLFECSAVELFVKRTTSLNDNFALNTRNSASIASICRHLDGIPLAIEFAAGRTATLGVQQVVADLRHRFDRLTSRRRTAIPRHKTLRAVLDWSYDLLAAPEQKYLRSLGIFAGLFSLDDAIALTRSEQAAVWLSGLVDKSLVVVESRGALTVYRLLDTTRTYSIERLRELGELEAAHRAHATLYRDIFERSTSEWETRSDDDLHTAYAWRLDNLRAAISWAFADGRTASLGVSIASAAIPLWMHLSLFDEARSYLAKALASIPLVDDTTEERHMKLLAAHGVVSLYSGGEPAEAEQEIGRAHV